MDYLGLQLTRQERKFLNNELSKYYKNQHEFVEVFGTTYLAHKWESLTAKDPWNKPK